MSLPSFYKKSPSEDSDSLESVFDPDQYGRFANLAEAFYFNADKFPELVAYDQAMWSAIDDPSPRQYATTFHNECAVRVLTIASRLREYGVQPGDAIAVLSLERPEWTEAEMAIYTTGAHAAAVYVRDGESRLLHMLRDSQAKYIFVENQEQLEKVLGLMDASESSDRDQSKALTLAIKRIIVFEDAVVPSPFSQWADRVERFSEVLSRQSPQPQESFPFVFTQSDDIACIYYTSGSSGMPKGVAVTHGQALANMLQVAAAGLVDYEGYVMGEDATDQPFVTFILPERAHAFPARTAQLVFTSPARARFPAIVDRKASRIDQAYRDSLRRDLCEGAAGIIQVVPKIVIEIERAIRRRLNCGSLAERFAGWVIRSETDKILAEATGTTSRLTKLMHRVLAPLRRKISARIRAQVVGPDFEYFISGGAKLPLETAAFLWAIHLPVHEGYGTTETNCPVAVNTPTRHRIGSVGVVFDGIEVSVDKQSGELLFRGPNLAQRYLNEPAETEKNWTRDGWYRTRDIGRIDPEGFLFVEDRLDQMMVLLNGENVSATAVENRFAAIPYVDTAIVVGHQRPAVVALIALNEAEVRRWAEQRCYPLSDDWRSDPDVVALLREEIETKVNLRAQRELQRVRHFGFIDKPQLETRTLTATEKVKRRELEWRNADLIESLYRNQADWLPSNQNDAVPGQSNDETGLESLSADLKNEEKDRSQLNWSQN